MTEPTETEIERVSVAIASGEMRRVGMPPDVVALAETIGRDLAVQQWGDLARDAIIAIRSPR